MSLTPSTMLPLGTLAPDFALPDTTNNNAIVRLSDFADRKALLVMFICNHCPYVKHVAKQLAAIGREYQSQSVGPAVGVIAISSNDADTYTEDSPEKMNDEATAQGYTFPYLHDATQQVAHAYTAACTPDFFLFASSDSGDRLAYRGQLDETRPTRISSGNYNFDDSPAHGRDLRAALDAVLKGEAPAADQKPSMGCNIKWKPGNEPEYFG